MAEILPKLFGSEARVKILRLFLLNPQAVFDADDLKTKTHISANYTRKEIDSLLKIGLLQRRTITRTAKTITKKRKERLKKKKVRGFGLNENFPRLGALKELFLRDDVLERESLAKRFRGVGRVKLLIISGVFIQDETSRLDLLIAGDSLKKPSIIRILRSLEEEVGRELRYGIFGTKDFIYRLDIYDRFVRDILDFPHEKLIDRLDIKSPHMYTG